MALKLRRQDPPLLKENFFCLYEGVLPEIGNMPFLWLPMARYEHLPLYKKAMDTAVRAETVVKGFSRHHKYTLGTDLRNQSHEIVRLVILANSQADKSGPLGLLRDTIEDLKVTSTSAGLKVSTRFRPLSRLSKT